jgi:hypothetical protein
MYRILLALGVAAAAVGLVTVGLGIPSIDFGLGHTLVIAGTTLLSGGLVLIGLAAATHQLARLTDALGGRGVAAMPRAEEAGEAAAQKRIPFPQRPPAAEPRVEPVVAAPPTEPSAEPPSERPRPRVPTLAPRVEPVMEMQEEPVAQRANARGAPYSPARPSVAAMPLDPRMGPAAAPRANGTTNGVAPAAAPPGRTERRAAPRGLFESVWPAESKRAKAGAREPKPGAAEDKAPAETAPETQQASVVPAEEPLPSAAPAAAPSGSAEEPRPVSILKSGVVDGMAYTLYSDGSIEAQLPEGTVRFASLTELRDHLDQNS